MDDVSRQKIEDFRRETGKTLVVVMQRDLTVTSYLEVVGSV